MATQKTLPTTVSPEQFLQDIPDETKRDDCREIIRMMETASKKPPVMWGPSIIGFGSYHYKYASGHEGDSLIIGFSPRKQNISLYLMSGLEPLSQELEKLGKHKTGKCCVYIKSLDDIDRKVLKQMISKAYTRFKNPSVL